MPFLRRRIILITVAVIVALGISAREFFPALTWAAKHHQIAVLPQGTRVRVPLFWLPGARTAAPDELRLHRANWGIHPAQEWVVLRTNTPPLLPERQRQSLGSLTKRLAPSNPSPALFPLPDDLQRDFQCLIPSVAAFSTWQLSCVSSDGLWALDLFGNPASQHDLATILRNIQSTRP